MRFFASLRMTKAGIRWVVGQPLYPPLRKGDIMKWCHRVPPFVKGVRGDLRIREESFANIPIDETYGGI